MEVSTLSRPEVIDALRAYVPTEYFHSILSCSTPFLKGMLMFYRSGGKEAELDKYFTTPEKKNQFYAIGLDFGVLIERAPGAAFIPAPWKPKKRPLFSKRDILSMAAATLISAGVLILLQWHG